NSQLSNHDFSHCLSRRVACLRRHACQFLRPSLRTAHAVRPRRRREFRPHQPGFFPGHERRTGMSILVIKPGMLSSFQDLGRTGHQHLGVPVGGAMDSRAHRLANLLVGNEENEATLEITLTGPTLRFDAPACIAICGAQLNPTLNKEPLPNNRPIIVRDGDVLAFGARASGLRAYLAWHGGIVLPQATSSRST